MDVQSNLTQAKAIISDNGEINPHVCMEKLHWITTAAP